MNLQLSVLLVPVAVLSCQLAGGLHSGATGVVPMTAVAFFLASLASLIVNNVRKALPLDATGGQSPPVSMISAGRSVVAMGMWLLAAFWLPLGRLPMVFWAVYSGSSEYMAAAFVVDLYFNRHLAVQVVVGYGMVVVASVVYCRAYDVRVSTAMAAASVLIMVVNQCVPDIWTVVFCTSVAIMALDPGAKIAVPLPRVVGPAVCMALAVYCMAFQYYYDTVDVSANGIVNALMANLIWYRGGGRITTNLAPMVRELLSHQDTRAIFQFLVLNGIFMVVQLVYLFRSGSLGLFSDSLHMALDCMSLALGLVAGLLSKSAIDPNSKYPFGYSRFETLAGFTNGTLLLGISGGIVFEAVTRLYNPVELQGKTELMVVSVMGLVVNLVGIFAFGHGNGHGHGHTHGHSHGHSHVSHESHESHENHHHNGHSHSHSSHNSSHSSHSSQTSQTSQPSHTQKDNESKEMSDNMRGIFLHILADTLGSVGVVVSTALTTIFSWNGFDPIASIVIALLIFASAIPLIKSTASGLLLSLGGKNEATIRGILTDLGSIKGLKSFTTPRFWPDQDKITGYIHVQVYKGESSRIVKKEVTKRFQQDGVDVMVQMEYDYDDCWCR